MKTSLVLSILLFADLAHADHDTDLFVSRVVAMPDTNPELAERAALSAAMLETERVPAEIMIAIAWGESRFDPTVITGRACGVMQTIAKDRIECQKLLTFDSGFRAGVAELEQWLRDPRVHGDLCLALAGYAAGNAGFHGSKAQWPPTIIERARRLGYETRGVDCRRGVRTANHPTS